MPRQARPSAPILPSRTLIIDNGGYTIKAGFATETPSLDDCRVIPNCIARSNDKKIYVGSELERCKDFGEMAFRRPVEKGYVVNWESEKAIWDHEFMEPASALCCEPQDTTLMLTEAPNSPQPLSLNCDQMVFEEYNFGAYYRVLGPTLSAQNTTNTLFSDPPSASPTSSQTLLVVDTGYSHTTITPFYQGRPLHPAIRRLTIGGKFMTNYLKDIISTRALYLMEETHLVNQIKEDVCFASLDFPRDLDRAWKMGKKYPHLAAADSATGLNNINVDYVLPDYVHRLRGELRPHDPSQTARLKRLNVGGLAEPKEDIVALSNERFTVPELLFSPSDIGLKEVGLPAAIMESLSHLDVALWPGMLANVVVVGGNSNIPNLTERLAAELRMLAPAEFPVRVARPEDPVKYAWLGGARLAGDREKMKEVVVTKQEYDEFGGTRVARKFATGKW
ncbi:actin-related protein-like protein 6 [Saccharata proteae CBS 121410]|uniref:Actin-like protein ARP6 n=1 Tax=Saccharata proteae CBS 121410 TaxID=1314787 RepID=A0A9P4HNA6_9PEZI|nr:actin-related protein-like protein 6 [Saccharata proteae CBS 121410]